jgi:hypothetical protein
VKVSLYSQESQAVSVSAFLAGDLPRIGGAFAQYQPRYAAVGIPTFPFTASDRRKRPLARFYNKIGLPASRQLVMDGLDSDGLACMAGPRNKITVVDVDAQGADGERLLADAQRDYGASSFIVRTGSGGFHAYYRHNGEGRRIRPDPGKPIDLLGGGVVVLPPSRGAKYRYEIIHGHIDDLGKMPSIRRVDAPADAPAPDRRSETITEGHRNEVLFRICMRAAHHCDDLESLLDVARTENAEMIPPMDDTEAAGIAANAWSYTQRGLNRFGQPGAWMPTTETNNLIASDQDAFLLLAFLRANNGPQSTFIAANGLAETFGWTRKRFARARRRLETTHLVLVRSASVHNGAALYRWRSRQEAPF